MKFLSAAFLVALTSCAFSVQAGVLVETVKRNKAVGKEEAAQTMQIQDGKARIESGGSRNTVSIFKDDTMYVLDTEHKTYMTMDRDTMERMASTVNDAMEKMRSKMADLPPEQRAMMENMMKQRGVPGAQQTVKTASLDATATGATESIDGRTCKVWNIKRDDKLSSQVCVVPYAGLPGHEEFQALAKKMSALFEKISERFANNMANNMGRQFTDNPFQQSTGIAAKINGVPFITRRYHEDALDPEETAIKVWKSQTIDATQFEIPAKYTKKEMMPQIKAK